MFTVLMFILLFKCLKCEILAFNTLQKQYSRCLNTSFMMYDKPHVTEKRSGRKKIIETNYTKTHRIFDVFSFTSEVGTLEIRLNELSDWVDKFVIIESDETFSGKKRTLVFPKIRNLKVFKKFENMVVYSVCRYPPSLDVKLNDFGNSIWKREYHMRNTCMKDSIENLKIEDHDIIIIGDIDEIVSHEGLG